MLSTRAISFAYKPCATSLSWHLRVSPAYTPLCHPRLFSSPLLMPPAHPTTSPDQPLPRSPPDEILILRSPPQYPIPLGPVMCRPPLMQKPPEVDGGHSETDIPTSLKLKRDFFSASRSVRPDWARCSSCLSLKSDDVDTRGGNMSTVKAGDISSVHRLSEQVLPPALQVLPAQPTPPPRLMLPVPPSNPGGPHRTRARDLLERLPLQVIPVLPVEPSKVCENRNANTFPAKAINTADFPYQSSNTFNGLSCGSPLFTNSNPNGSANQAFSTRCSQGLRSGPGRGRFLSDDTPYTPHDDGSPLCVRCGGGGLFPEVLTRRGSSAAPSADILLPPLASLLVGVGEAHVPLRRYGSENPSADNSNDAGGAMANATHADWRYSQGEMVVEHLDNNSLVPSVVFSVSSEASAEEQEERDVQVQEEWLREGEHPQASSTWVDDADAFHSSWTSCHKAGVSPLPAGANNNAPLPVKVVCSSSSSRFQPVGDGGGGEVCASPILFAPLDAMMAMNNGSNMLGHTSHGDEEDEVSTYLDGAAHEPEPYPECMWSAPTVALLRTRSFVSRNFDVLAPNGGGNRRNRYESVYDWLDVVTAQKSFTSLPTVAELCDSQMATHPLQQQQQQPIPVGTMESGPTTEDSMRVFSLAHDSKREETRSTVTGGAESQIKTICRKLTS